MEKDQIVLPIDEFPTKWYNIKPDLPEPLPPPKEPETGPSRMEYLSRTMLKESLRQEMSDERWISIPEEIRELYIHMGRPRPLYRAKRLEAKLGLKKVKLFYKREDLSPTGSHKANTAIAQAYYAVKEGKTTLSTETGAGQWGSALSYAARLLQLDCVVFWVRSVYDWKIDRKTLMQLLGAKVYPSPSTETKTGKEILSKTPKNHGSLGIAISEGLEYAEAHKNTVYCLGSVLNHVLIQQSVIGLETIKQFDMIDEKPDLIVACLGGGSNFGGIALPFIGEVLKGKRKCEFLAAQTEASPNLITGEYRYDFGDIAEHTPLMKMYTLGHKTDMVPVRADGLRYHAASPIISLLRKHKLIKAVSYPVDEKSIFEAARMFVQTEGWLPAPESSYAIRASIDEAEKAEKAGEEKTICMNISGHGWLDLEAYREKLGIS
ncbi:MAG: TrpB-like pyridoxal phosphate-dependent enzyme [Candidatus Bathyarchaeia archaeon]|jgi:tryptophan synthase beta chain